MKAGLYIHVPFCRKKCNYCGFFSGFRPDKDLVDKYVEYICKELELYRTGDFLITTVYLGGGTPSLLDEKHIEMISNFIFKNFKSDVKEFTIEANPDDVTLAKAKAWIDNCINRVSLGFQSMDDKILKFFGRTNTSFTNYSSYEALRKAGFKNISIDWIYSIKDGDINFLIDSIKEFDAEHYSLYSLSLDENTLLFQKYKKKEFLPKSDDDYLKDYRKINKFLREAGYLHYEVSNYAKCENFCSLHNLSYWDYQPYMGIGIGAVGFVYRNVGIFKGVRWFNHKNFRDYFSFLDNGILPISQREVIDLNTGIKEVMMLGLRKIAGFKFEDFYKIFKRNFSEFYDEKEIVKLKSYLKINKKGIALKLRYFPVMNHIISKMWENLKFKKPTRDDRET